MNDKIRKFIQCIVNENMIDANALLKEVVAEKVAAYKSRIEEDKFLGENRVLNIDLD